MRRTRERVSNRSEIPSSAKYSHWIGTRTESAATRPLSVRIFSDGGLSMRIKSYSVFTGASSFLRINSLSGSSIISIAAPVRFLSAGTSLRVSNSVLRVIDFRESPRMNA